MRRALLVLALAACGTTTPPPATAPDVPAAPAVPPFELVESWPVETSLDHADVTDVVPAWLDMIGGARRTLDIAEFYVSDRPAEETSRLHVVVEAIRRAAARGVRVRLLVDDMFYAKYPETVDALGREPGIQARRLKVGSLMGGVLHAKYFVVDGREVYAGSQNFDWRSLEHIQELGSRVRSPEIAGAVGDIFETDWELAGGAGPETRRREHTRAAWPLELGTREHPLRVTPVASPRAWLPDESLWELPRMVRMLDEARHDVRIQVLTYKTTARDGSPFPELDQAVRRAAARGVTVRLLVSEWNRKQEARAGLDALAQVPHVEIRVLTIPDAKAGPIPFARVAHAKYAVVDGATGWVGSSNWEGDYFTRSRNVGMLFEGSQLATQLERFFDLAWAGPYAAAWSR